MEQKASRSVRRVRPATNQPNFKPYKIPPDFALVIDTREQKPLFDPPPDDLTIIHKKLDHGDYSINGFEKYVAIERKRMSDLMTYVCRDKDKTAEKLYAMRDIEFKALVVEESWDDLFLPKNYSQVPIEFIRQALVSFNIRYGLHIFVHPYRSAVERWVLDRLLYFHKHKRRV